MGHRLGCHVIFFAFLLFASAGLGWLLLKLLLLPCARTNQSLTHTLGQHRPASVVSVAATRTPPHRFVHKRCSVASTSRWHRHHTDAPDSSQICLNQGACYYVRLYRPLGSAVAVPSMAFPDGNTCPSPFRNHLGRRSDVPSAEPFGRIGRHLPAATIKVTSACQLLPYAV